MTLDGASESPRTWRLRRLATGALKPLSILGPIALVLSAGLIPPSRAEEGSTLLRDTIIVAVLVLAGLLALVRVYEIRWARIGERLFSSREAVAVVLLVFLLAWWCMGLNFLAHGPGSGDRLGGLAFVNGMFGVVVVTALLFRWGLRREPGPPPPIL